MALSLLPYLLFYNIPMLLSRLTVALQFGIPALLKASSEWIRKTLSTQFSSYLKYLTASNVWRALAYAPHLIDNNLGEEFTTFVFLICISLWSLGQGGGNVRPHAKQ